MSKVKIQGNASGTGTLTISAPNTNTDRTLTLPDGAGEILLANGDGSSLTGIVGGKILQVVEQTSVTQTTTSSGNYTDSGFDKNITPTSSSSKILVILNTAAHCYRGSSGAYSGYTRFQRNGSNIGKEAWFGGYLNVGSSNWIYTQHTAMYLDSPSTTSSTRYQVQLRGETSGLSVTIGADYRQNEFLLVEIGA